MGADTKVEWADHTFNPWIGCTKVSAACDNCYAETLATARLGVQWGPHAERRRTAESTWRQPLAWNRKSQRGGRRYRVFCASLADVMDNQVPIAWLVDALDVVRITPHLIWMLLTKRPQMVKRRLREALSHLSQGNDRNDLILWLAMWLDGYPPENVWLGTTVENREEMHRRGTPLRFVPAARKFWSCEPLLGELGHIPAAIQPDWVIAGGESGPRARPSHPDWFRGLRDQCQAAGVPFFFKQWGEWRPICQGEGDWYDSLYRSRVAAREGEDQAAKDEAYGRICTVDQLCLRVDGQHASVAAPMAWLQGTRPVLGFRVGKRAAGATLDGREWREVPGG